MKFRFSVRTSAPGLILFVLVMFALFVSPQLHTHAATKADLADTTEQSEMMSSDLNVLQLRQETAEKQQSVLYLRVVSELVKTFYIA